MKVMTAPATKLFGKPVSVRAKYRTRSAKPVLPSQHNAKPADYSAVHENLSLAMRRTIMKVHTKQRAELQ